MMEKFQIEAPTTIAKIRHELDAEWSNYVIKGIEPRKIRPQILNSWHRCHDLYQIDPGLQKSPIRLSPEELQARRERNEVLQVGRTFFEELTRILADTGHVLALFDADGWMLERDGDPALNEPLEDINFVPGSNWKEEFVGNNGPGTALAEKRPVQIYSSEHYVQTWHPWVCSGAPILDPVSQEPLAVLDATGYKETVHPHTLLVVAAAARAIEREIGRIQVLKDQQILHRYLNLAAGRLSDGLLAVDHRGRVLQINPAAARILQLKGELNTLDACPPLRQVLLPALYPSRPQQAPQEREIYCPQLDRYLVTVTFPIVQEGQTIGAIVLIPDRGVRARQPAAEDAGRPSVRRKGVKRTSVKYTFDDILGESPGIKQALKLARLAAGNNLPVLITGDSGTGKEMIAQAIHAASARADGPFVAINCGSIPQELIQSELFGYEGGAFTGARRGGNRGKFEEAHEGTIFLDEVSELSAGAQVALLRVLQEMEVVRLGGSAPTTVDVRVIAATNEDLHRLVEARTFRHDLYYRLNVLTIELPPLRERREDIPILAQAFLEATAAQLGRPPLRLSPEAMSALTAYHWPGNVRELKNVIQRVAALCENPIIRCRDLPPEVRGAVRPLSGEQSTSVRSQEREELLQMLRRNSGNVSETARQLGVSRMTLYRRMKKYAISKSDIFGSDPC
ncbi:MAG: sigma-54-dependent Fis family transcriptional regulator [Acidobacteria bacterium]|nr:MAG: sigma-54-dependent Fis family transcriptional regulator [Acidobacteriota bacterium]